MLIISLILLLLSNAITSRRDKSILYSRVTITMLVICTLIAYDGLYFCFILVSIGLYLLSIIYRDSEPATSGGLMYFLLGGLSSCFNLLSIGLLYANSGTTNLNSLYIITTFIIILITEKNVITKHVNIKINNIAVSSSLSMPISIITLIIALFIFIPEEWLSITNLLALILFNT